MRFRNETKKVKIGNLIMGGNNHVIIQSMTNTKTSDVKSTVSQIKELEKAGCELVRVAVLDMNDAKAIKEIKKHINIPLSADIHFDYRLAIEAITNGVDKIRLNPGNIKDKKHIKEVVDLCKANKVPIRIGVNSGSLPNLEYPTVSNMIEACKMHVDILEELDFHDIVISLKASDPKLMIEVYKEASNEFPYPIHLGVTEAGPLLSGSIKNSIGIGILLNEGIGNTIRVSLTGDPVTEIYVAKEILKDLDLRNDIPNLISCPTCGRIEYNMIEIANKIEDYLKTVNKGITVAIMGCKVNGPGEASHADIGIAGGKNEAILFKKGKPIRSVKENNILEELIKEIDNY